MTKKILLILLLLSIIPIVTADQVGVLIRLPDGFIYGEYLEADAGTNGYDLLQKLSLSTEWAGPSAFGHMLCKVNNVGQEVSGDFCSSSGNKFWRFLIALDNEWEPIPVGADYGENCWNGDLTIPLGDHYCVKDGDLIALDFIESSWPDPDPKPNTLYPINPKDVKVYANSKKQNDADELGGDIKAVPGSTILFKIELENNFIINEELKVKDIEVKITINDIDDGKDIEEEISFKNLDIEENDKKEIEFTIPVILEDDDYDVILEITSKNPIGIFKKRIIEYSLEINKEKHDLIFTKAKLQNLESCPNQPNSLSLEVTNIGEKNEENVLLNVKSDYLNLDFSDSFGLNEGEERSVYTKDIPFSIPQSLNPGDYNIKLDLDYSEKTNEEITLTVKDCNQQTSTEDLTQTPQTTENIIELGVKKATPVQQTAYKRAFLEIYVVPVLLGAFLLFLITSLALIVVILNI